MRIIFDIGHPGHVHLYKYVIKELIDKGNSIKIVAREREITYYLLDRYGFQYIEFPHGSKLLMKPISISKGLMKLLKIANQFEPDIFVSTGSHQSAQASAILNRPHISFVDTEVKKYSINYFISNLTAKPFTDSLCAPSGFKKTTKAKKIRYKGYHELAYLHPNRFKPDPKILDILDLEPGEKFVILRFSAFDAGHDFKIRGFAINEKRKLVLELEKYAKVIISSELTLEKTLKKYLSNIPPEKIHDAMYYASLLVGDAGTMTTEAACLGTPAIFFHPRAKELSNFVELEEKYGLIFGYNIDRKKAIEKAFELIQNPSLKKEWQRKRKKLLEDKIDVTSFMVWFIENYPKSHKIMKKYPNYDERFR